MKGETGLELLPHDGFIFFKPRTKKHCPVFTLSTCNIRRTFSVLLSNVWANTKLRGRIKNRYKHDQKQTAVQNPNEQLVSSTQVRKDPGKQLPNEDGPTIWFPCQVLERRVGLQNQSQEENGTHRVRRR